MAIQDAIKGFVVAHSGLMQEIEKLALKEIIALISSLYPNDPVLATIAQKISDEVLKLQGIPQDPQ